MSNTDQKTESIRLILQKEFKGCEINRMNKVVRFYFADQMYEVSKLIISKCEPENIAKFLTKQIEKQIKPI